MKQNCWNCRYLVNDRGQGMCVEKILSCTYEISDGVQMKVLKKRNECDVYQEKCSERLETFKMILRKVDGWQSYT